jgi:hypothetical protein
MGFEFDGEEFDELVCTFASPNHSERYVAYCSERCGWSTQYGDLPRDDVGYFVLPPWCPRCGPGGGEVHTDRAEWIRVRKKPVDVLARRVEEREEIVTREGTLTAVPGDYVIRGVEGELYPIDPGIFAKTYDVVDAGEAEG